MKLHKPVYRPLKLKEIKPEGWLKNQLRIQAEGLSGNLDKFWPDIKDSQWIGGEAEGWERVPYWLDGFLPLAWLLDDEDLKRRAETYMEKIISRQQEDGWICPDWNKSRSQYDVWALFLLLKVLVQYYEAKEDERIVEVVRKALMALDRHIDRAPLFNWGQFRWFEGLVAIWWLYEKTGEDWLLDLASKIRSQGFDWGRFFRHWPYRMPDEKKRWSFMSHVVNNAMALKEGALSWRLTGDKEDLDSIYKMAELLDKYHGMVTGVFTGDECLAGLSPVQGTELCAVAEYMYSLEHIISVTGDAKWGDRLEKIAYNALPATYSPDMWTHQYDQQVNQVECSRQPEPVFQTNGPESNLFGLEPNFGCCTANLSQAWPKLALSACMKSEDGLAVVVYAPFTANTVINDTKVSLSVNTDYPFRDKIRISVKSSRPQEFTVWLRVPEWTQEAYAEIQDEKIQLKAGGFHPVKRVWSQETEIVLVLPMKTVVLERLNGLYAVVRGPLVYSLAIKEEWKRVNEDIPGREFPHCDYEVYPASPWNYGLCIDKDNPEKDIVFEEHSIGSCPFSPEGAPISAKVKAKKVDWKMENGAAAPVPGLEWVSEEIEEVRLIPYGCTNLRLTEMPLVE
ncbi:MAG TPA: hypothetical protein GX505_12080 [Clostridiales bacterium]|nr:hypothetical protein [Clostridiales bacterium]